MKTITVRSLGLPLLAPVAAAIWASFAFAQTPGPTPGAVERVSERVLLVRDKPGTPTLFWMIVNSGCNDEEDGRCRGLAHYVEHLVLVGRNPEHDAIALRFFSDGSSNGTTDSLATTFEHSMPARAGGPRADLEKLFGFYAARLRDFSISEAEAVRERDVVLREHDWRYQRYPLQQFHRKVDLALLPDHPMGTWPIGPREEIKAFTVDAARAFHRRWYVINNVYFVLRGDIDPVMLKEISGRALSDLAMQTLPPRAALQQPKIASERKDFREADDAIKRGVVMVKRLVSIAERDVLTSKAACKIVENFLASRLPGSLYEMIVERETLASTLSVELERIAPSTYRFSVYTNLAPGAAPERLVTAINDYIDALAGNGMLPRTIEQLKTRYANDQATIDRLPAKNFTRLTNWIKGGDPYEELELFRPRVAALSPEDIATVLAGLSSAGRVVTGILLPTTPEPQQ